MMAFSRALGREGTFDPAALAPPTFSQAAAHYDPDSHLRPHPGIPWKGSGRTSSGAPAGGEGWLHAEQHFSYVRHPHAGETLTFTVAPGRTWTKSGSGNSVLDFAEEVTEYRDAAGEIVLTSTIVRVRKTGAPQ